MKYRQSYVPALGRFGQEDPVLQVGLNNYRAGCSLCRGSINKTLVWQKTPQMLNAYQYVFNNPVSAADPLGLKVTYCVGFSKDVPHGWLKVNGDSYGFYPESGWEIYAGLNPTEFVPGEIRDDKRLHCILKWESKDDCADNCVKQMMEGFKANPPDFSLEYFNCFDLAAWVWSVCVHK